MIKKDLTANVTVVQQYYQWKRNNSMQPYTSGNIWQIDAFFEAWVDHLRLRFSDMFFQLDKNEHNSFYATANFYSIVVQMPVHAGTNRALLFMVHKETPLAVWGTALLRSKPPGGENFEKWYLLPDNLYNNEMGAQYDRVLNWMVNDLEVQGLDFLPKETWLKKHGEAEQDIRNHCININDSLRTLYGYTFNILENIKGL